MVDQVGTLSVQPCLSITLENSLTFTVVDMTLDSLIMRLRFSNPSVVQDVSRL